MKTKLFITVSLILVLVFSMAWTTGAVSAGAVCDPNFVTQTDNVIIVKPTGIDDTGNLQCAFDAAVTSGPGVHVNLLQGTFYLKQIVVNGFRGQFTGSGVNKTVVSNLPHLQINNKINWYRNPPSADNQWPSLLSFIDGQIVISDLTIHIAGEDLTTGWGAHGSCCVEELGIGIAFLGSETSANVSNILFEGEMMQDSLWGYNLVNAIVYEGFWDCWFKASCGSPITGSFGVQDSVFRRVVSGTPVFSLSDASVVISGNFFEEVFFGAESVDLQNSYFEFSNNTVNGVFGVDLYNMLNTEDIGSAFLISNNNFQGAYGPIFEQTFGDGNSCLILGNNVQNVSDIGIYLGPGIKGCTVVGGNNATNVLDLGTDNILSGVNNMEVGIGPDINQLIRMKP